MFNFALWQDTLTDWPLGTIFGVLMIVGIIGVVGLILWGLFIAVDSWFQPREQAMGKVCKKKFTPAHVQIIQVYNAATKTSLPQPIFHPDHWSVSIEVNGMSDSISVSHKAYDSVSEGVEVMAEYVTGRISGGFYLKGFSLI